LIDNNGNIVSDDEYLDKIKQRLCDDNEIQLVWNNHIITVYNRWLIKDLDNIEQQLMGDLFCCSAYDYDSIIVEHTKQVVSGMQNKYKIRMHISKLIGDKTILKGTFGSV
jgi:hypothetical protein